MALTYGVPGSIAPLTTNSVVGATDSSLGNVLGQVTGTQDQAAPGQPLGASIAPTLTPDQIAAQQAAATAAATAAANDTAINNGINTLGTQQAAGNQGILNSYNTAFGNLLNGKTNALNGYNNTRNQTQLDNQTAQDNIGQGVGSTNQALQRLLGSHGAGSSSAAQILAPYAAAHQGAIQSGQVQNTYDKNMSGIDQAINNYNTSYDTSQANLAKQRDQQYGTLQQGIDNSKASLLGQRSDAVNNQSQIQSLLNAAASLGITPAFTPQAVNAAAPTLDQYNYTPNGAPTVGGATPNGNSALSQSAGPFWSLLNGQKDKTLTGATA